MKRLAVVVMAVLALVMLVSVASAEVGMYTYKWVPVHMAHCLGGNSGSPDYLDMQRDSLSFYRRNVADTQDTSLVVPMPADFVVAPAQDSMPCFLLRATCSVAANGADTMYAMIQPSADGVNFTEGTWFNGAYNDIGLLSGAVTYGVKAYRLAATYGESAQWQNVAPQWGIKAVRVRLYADGSAATSGNGVVNLWLGYLAKVGN